MAPYDPSMVVLGVVGKPHGVRGEVMLRPHNVHGRSFEGLRSLTLVRGTTSTTHEIVSLRTTPDGAIAKTIVLEAPNPLETSDPAVAALLRRRRELEVEAEELKGKKDEMPQAEWDAAFEKLMIELARISRQLKPKS